MNIHDTITNAPNDARVIIESANATDIFTIFDLKKVIHKMYDRGVKNEYVGEEMDIDDLVDDDSPSVVTEQCVYCGETHEIETVTMGGATLKTCPNHPLNPMMTGIDLKSFLKDCSIAHAEGVLLTGNGTNKKNYLD